MDAVQIHQGDDRYPSALHQYLGNRAPKTLMVLGALNLLQAEALALFCSIKCPGSLILKTHDLAQQLKQSNLAVIGGFHSPVERECLTVLLRSKNPLIVCSARSLTNMRIPSEYKKPIDEGRLLLLSPFAEKQNRATTQMAIYRNELVAALAKRVFIAYAEREGKTERFCRKIIAWQKPLYTFASEETANLVILGATTENISLS